MSGKKMRVCALNQLMSVVNIFLKQKRRIVLQASCIDHLQWAEPILCQYDCMAHTENS